MMLDTGPKFYSAILTALAHGLKVKVKNLEIFILKCFNSSYFPNHMIDMVHIWNDNRYRSKVLFIIAPTHACDLKVKVTDLEIL